MAHFEIMEEPTGSIPDAQDMVRALTDELRYSRLSMMQDIYNRHSGEVISRDLLDGITAEIEDTLSRQLMMPNDCDMHMAVQCFVARAMSSRLQNPDWLYEYMDVEHEQALVGLLGELPVAI